MIALALALVLTADVHYDFRDKNGVGWVMTSGTVTVTFTFTKDGGTLAIKGTRRWVDAQLVAGTDPKGAPGIKEQEWSGGVTEKLALKNVARTGDTITFDLDAFHDKLTGTCAPATIAQLASKSVYECTLTGFQWHPVARLPELHHPVVFESNPKAKQRIVNKLTGQAKPKFGQRTVTAVKPEKPKQK